MNLIQQLRERLDSFHSFTAMANGVRMNTHCIYPNNGFVKVAVLGAGDTYFVTDEGGAIREAEISGALIEKPDEKFHEKVKSQGLTMRGAVIISPDVSLSDLPAAISMVANASQDIAESIFDDWKLARNRNFKGLLKHFLKSEFSEKSVHAQEIAGDSTKKHSFDTVVQFLNGSRLIVDAVLKDTRSINSRLVAHLDIKQAGHTNLRQAIIYDDEEEWSLADLNLLQVSKVPILPFSTSAGPLREMAHG